MSTFSDNKRVVSGMRATGPLHLGHYHGVLQNWVKLQHQYDCLFFVADWHGLTTHYEHPELINDSVWNMVIDWLACGVNPSLSHIFIQSKVPAHAELHLLLSMITPLGWLERVPTYKDQQEKLRENDLSTYGFLGYPLLQSADILLYNAKYVPVGEDQVCHVELTREVARRFNYIYGREAGFEERALEIVKKLGTKKAALYEELRVNYQQNGDDEALEKARFILSDAINLSVGEEERLYAFLENKSRIILTEPQALVTKTPKLVGIDGQKMSKSYNNTIMLRESDDSINKKIKAMPTDPARVRREDKGDPEKCPVWQLHKVYSNDEVQDWVKIGCTNAGIGCIDCKKPLIDSICAEQNSIKERAKPFLEDHNIVKNILADGAEKAAIVASQNLAQVKEAMNLNY